MNVLLQGFMYGMCMRIDYGIQFLASKRVDYCQAVEVVTCGAITTIVLSTAFAFSGAIYAGIYAG